MSALSVRLAAALALLLHLALPASRALTGSICLEVCAILAVLMGSFLILTVYAKTVQLLA